MWLLNITSIGLTGLPARHGLAQVDEEDAEAACLVGELVVGRRAGEQDHQVGVGGAGDKHLAAVDYVAVAIRRGEGVDARRVGASVRLGDAEGLQAQLAEAMPGR